ncbi:MAG: transcriptional repressor [Flaviflexus sp.]|uniref:Fur family transcriptional regulator n=1 Tax=Flaviflexus sp. TaxID=1969482 RepID=UPI00352E9252
MSKGVGQPIRRSTRARSLIWQALESTDRFLSAQGMHELLTERGEDVGLATVYRSLQMFADDGDVDCLRDSDGEMLYRKCMRKAHHHHLICRRCDRTQEVEDHAIEEWAEKTAQQYGFANVSHTFELYGVCADCQKAANA